jgi:uncharacterized membrane protein
MQALNSLFDMGGIQHILRFFHTFAGLIWIGHLYYLNFVQGGYMNDLDAAGKSMAQQKLFPRAFWWFRHGALWTMIIGIILLLMEGGQQGANFQWSSYWVNILTGGLMGMVMGTNVWMVIWPVQREVIANAVNVASGKPANASIAARLPRAALASRTNVLLSIPMLFFMLSARHWQYGVENLAPYWIAALLVIGAIEANVFKGKMGPMTTVKGVLTSGFVLLVVFILMIGLLI